MKFRSISVALLGLAVAGGSAYVAGGYMNSQFAAQKAALDPQYTVSRIVVASQDIPFGVPLTAQMLRYQDWPKAALPQGSFQDIADLVKSGSDPRRAKSAVPAGIPVLASEVSGFGEKVTLVNTLGENGRAMAIKVDAVTAVGGFVTPGDRVDVILTQGRAENMRSVTILQDIRVLGVDQTSDESSDKATVARTVTVEVTAEQSQKLALAQKVGTLSLSLRSMTGVNDEKMTHTTVNDLLNQASATSPGQAQCTVTVTRGGDVQKVNVPVQGAPTN